MKPSFSSEELYERIKDAKYDPNSPFEESGIEDSADVAAFRKHATKTKEEPAAAPPLNKPKQPEGKRAPTD